ncbi:MAG: hypothetical protein A2Y57_02010 [Candidatus Woykebacteria bacterium RBG_13_40_7b]|uniref:Polyprenyl synthetase n=1 Tax=Candidatus Woykebacteria bacterium RBG_13_40_7b TaxID=1802594 RepID=A0A1G1WA79_9BACT|nr:MAG: hypothetical protein A2Y57_02010 [Candidatus Woykebacteria bacterium RBG_13_40_7b]
MDTEKFLNELKVKVDEQIFAFLSEKKKEFKGIKESLDLINEIERFLKIGGKRLRPTFVYVGYLSSGGKKNTDIFKISASVEFIHTFALIHDDIMDQSLLRRGQPTTYHLFSKKYGEHFGISAAILAGDLAKSFADDILSKSRFPKTRIVDAMQYLSLLKEEVEIGQYLDIFPRSKKIYTEKEVLEIAKYKAGKYTVERPLHLGAALAGAEKEVFEALSDYGIPLGIAFQIQDDILGTFGEEEVMGKVADLDIKEGKKTLLSVKAWEWANNSQRKILAEVLGDRGASLEKIEMVREIFKATGSYDFAKDKAADLIFQAKKALEKAPVTREGKEYLSAAADFLLERKY